MTDNNFDINSSGSPAKGISSITRRQSMPRALVACNSCRKRKLRCDGDGINPCSRCCRSSEMLGCTYTSSDYHHAVRRNLLKSKAGRHASELPSPSPTVNRQLLEIQAAVPSLNPPASRVPAQSYSISQSNASTVGVADHLDRQLSHVQSVGDGNYCINSQLQARRFREHNNAEESGSDDGEDRINMISSQNGSGNVTPVTEGMGSVNTDTLGFEFYGRSGMFPFLGRLQRKAGLHKQARGKQEDTIIASLLYRPSDTGVQNHPRSLPRGEIATSEADTARKIDTLIARALHCPNGLALVCIRNFFSGLHLVHPLFDETVFRNRCKRELWCIRPRNVSKGLEALYYATLALGALVSNMDDFHSAILEPENEDLSVFSYSNTTRSPFNLTMRIARRCFEHAKTRLTDIFEVSNLERTQALYLLSVYCQNTLNPHSCHLYSGMAVTTAIAIGLPQGRAHQSFPFDIGPHPEPRSWWCIYAHEVEMSCASGRETLLESPTHYKLAFPADVQPKSTTRATHDTFINIMVSLAGTLRQIFKELYQQYDFDQKGSRDAVHKLAQELDDWRMHLPPIFNFERVSLTDPDHIRREKVVLKIRYYNAQILLYRRYVETWSRHAPSSQSATEINFCLEAATKTIRLLFDTCQHESYFRTWWYNNTYLLNAAMVALAVAFTRLTDDSVDEIFGDVQKALDVFDAMGAIIVARRCALVIKDVYRVAQRLAEKLKTASELSITPASGAAPDAAIGDGTGVGPVPHAGMGTASGSNGQVSFQDSMLPEDIWSSIFGTGQTNGVFGFAQDEDFDFNFDMDSLMG